MRFTPIAAASVIALGALLGGFTASTDADAPGTAQRTVALASSTDVTLLGTADNNGNG